MTPDNVICRNIQFDRERGYALVIGDNAVVYFCEDRVARGLMNLSAAELAQYLGALVAIDGRTCRGFRARPETQLATGDDESLLGGGDDFARPMGATPPATKVDTRKVLDRYGLAVEVKPVDGSPTLSQVIAYPLMRYGAISPVGTVVTRWTPEFLEELNRVLGTTYTLDHFGAAPEDDGFPF